MLGSWICPIEWTPVLYKLQVSFYLGLHLRRYILRFLIALGWIKTPTHTHSNVYGQYNYLFLQYTCGWPCSSIYSHRLVALILDSWRHRSKHLHQLHASHPAMNLAMYLDSPGHQ